MADASPTLPAWWPEAVTGIATAIAGRLGVLLFRERRQKATDRRSTAAEAVLREIEHHEPPYGIPTPWVKQFRAEAAAVSAAQMRLHEDAAAQMRLHEDAVRVHIDAQGDLKHRVSSLESGQSRQDERLERMEMKLDACQRTTQETALLLARIAGRLGVEE